MSERKVLNKYYPPDFDARKLPKAHRKKSAQFIIRLMAPMSLKCNGCGEYIYKGKKFNARQETVRDENYLGLRIFRFYIKCPRCLSEITFKTDYRNADYIVEHGAKRCFDNAKLALKIAEKDAELAQIDDNIDPMKILQDRTADSKREMDILEKLEEIKELNLRHADIDHDVLLQKHFEKNIIVKEVKVQEDLDDQLIKNAFYRKKIEDDDSMSVMSTFDVSTKPTSDFVNDSVNSNDPKKSTNPVIKPVVVRKRTQAQPPANTEKKSSSKPILSSSMSLLQAYSSDESD